MRTKKLQHIRGVLHWYTFGGEQKPTTIILRNGNGEKVGELIPSLIFPDNPEPCTLILEIDLDIGSEQLKAQKLLMVTLRDCFD